MKSGTPLRLRIIDLKQSISMKLVLTVETDLLLTALCWCRRWYVQLYFIVNDKIHLVFPIYTISLVFHMQRLNIKIEYEIVVQTSNVYIQNSLVYHCLISTRSYINIYICVSYSYCLIYHTHSLLCVISFFIRIFNCIINYTYFVFLS